MNSVKLLMGALMMTAIAGCATRYTIVSAPAVSMNQRSIPAHAKVHSLGPVTSRYCMGDDSITGRKDQIGLLDEVILRAQKESKASYISDAQFFGEGKCVVLEGVGMALD